MTISHSELQAKIQALRKRLKRDKATESAADMLDSSLAPLLRAFKSLDSHPIDFAAALDELRAALGVTPAMHQRLLALVGSEDQLREEYLAAARLAGVQPPLFPDDLDKPILDALRAGLPNAVATAINDSRRLDGKNILSQFSQGFIFGVALKPE